MSTINSAITATTLSMMNGLYGMKVADSTTVLTDLGAVKPAEYFYGIVKAKTAAVVNLKARSSVYGDSTITAISIPAGEQICGKFDLVTVVSGDVIIYLGKEANPAY